MGSCKSCGPELAVLGFIACMCGPSTGLWYHTGAPPSWLHWNRVCCLSTGCVYLTGRVAWQQLRQQTAPPRRCQFNGCSIRKRITCATLNGSRDSRCAVDQAATPIVVVEQSVRALIVSRRPVVTCWAVCLALPGFLLATVTTAERYWCSRQGR